MKDRQLLPLIQRYDYVFVTNNRLDWRRLHASEELHNGLVVIIPNVERDDQIALFERVLDYVAALNDLINTVLEIGTNGRITVAPLSAPPV